MYSIKVNFEQKGLTPVTLENIDADQSLLEVMLDNGIELHHNCGAVCACSTCHLYVNKGMEHLAELSDKEEYRLYDILNNNELSEVDYNTKINQSLLFGGGNGEDTNEDTNNLLICIMKNIMLANKNDFDIIKDEYKKMK